MDLRYGKAYEDFRDEVKAFLTDNWPPKGDEARLERSLQAARFRERAVPARYGGTANIQRNIIAERGLGLSRDWAAQRSPS